MSRALGAGARLRIVWTLSIAALLLATAMPGWAAPQLGGAEPGTTAYAEAAGTVEAFYGSGFLGTRNMFTIRGNMVSAGRGMRGTGTGTITIAGIPAGAQVWLPRLYWVSMGPTSTPPTVNGTPVQPELLGTSGHTCWPNQLQQYAYSADLWSLFTGNGDYVVAGLPASGPGVNDTQGASIVAFYRDTSMPLRDFILWDGAISLNLSGATATTSLQGFVPDSPVADAAVTFLVGDGQVAGDIALFNGTAVGTPDAFPGTDGPLWDTKTWNVTSLAQVPPPWSATVTSSGGDCLVWEAVILASTSARSADLSITKTGPPSFVVGSDVTYHVQLTNTGPDWAHWITPSDTIPAGSTFLSIANLQNIGCNTPPVGSGGTIYCGIGGLGPGESASYDVTVRSHCPVGPLSSTASVNVFDPDPDPSDNSVTVVTPSAPIPVTITAPASVCADAKATASISAGPAGTTYVWTVTNGAIVSGQGTPTIQFIPSGNPVTVSVTGVYFDTVCAFAGSVQVGVKALPSGSITVGPTVCLAAKATASVTTGAASPTYYWSITPFGGLASIVGADNGPAVSFVGTLPGEIAVECTIIDGGTGCRTTLSSRVTVIGLPPSPSITAPAGAALHEAGLVASVPATAGSTFAWTVANGTLTAGQGTASITFTAGEPGSTVLTVVETNASGCSSAPASAAVTVGGPEGPCLVDATTLCLNKERFKVQVSWTAADGTPGPGQAVALAPVPSDTGYFWFFDAANMELLIKVLDGRAVNGKFWVMYGALSDVEYTITVVDTVTLATKTYSNPKGTLASAADIDAFADPERSESTEALAALAVRPVSVTEAMLLASPRTGLLLVEAAPEPVLTQLSACVPDATTLCLNSGRFRLTTSWNAASSGAGGLGHAVPVTTDSGLFWFFYPGNIELAIKVLDGRGVNGMFWVLYGALSDVHYTIRIDDTVTGASKLYDNPQGVLASKADILAFTP